MSHLVSISSPSSREEVIENARAVRERFAAKEREAAALQAEKERLERALRIKAHADMMAKGREKNPTPSMPVERDYIFVATPERGTGAKISTSKWAIKDEDKARRMRYPVCRLRRLVILAERHYFLSAGEVFGQRRTIKVTQVRMWLVALIHKLRPDLSAAALGRMFGGRDHTTILHSMNKNMPRPHWGLYAPILRRRR